MTDSPQSLTQEPQNNADDTVHVDDPDRPPGLSIDWELYEHYLEDSDLSEEDKRAFIETLWSIMVSFADLGFRINPVQEICGEIDPLAALVDKSIRDVVKLEDTNKKLNGADDGESDPSKKGVAHEL